MKTRRGCPRHPKKAAFPGHMRESLIWASSEAHLSLGSIRMDTRYHHPPRPSARRAAACRHCRSARRHSGHIGPPWRPHWGAATGNRANPRSRGAGGAPPNKGAPRAGARRAARLPAVLGARRLARQRAAGARRPARLPTMGARRPARLPAVAGARRPARLPAVARARRPARLPAVRTATVADGH